MDKIIINKIEDVGRLDMIVNHYYPDFSRAHIQNLIKSGNISIERNKRLISNCKNGEKLKINDVILIDFPEVQDISLSPEKLNFEIVYEDDDLAVVNKPQGLVVHPCSSCKSGTLVNGLLDKISNLSGINGVARPGIVHRIDKDTAGLLVVAKNDNSHIVLSKQIANKTCKRKYTALIDGHFKNPEGIIQTFIDRDKKDRKKMTVSDTGKWAITEYKTIEFYKDYSLVEFELKTGRTHQIRVHAKFLNHPIVGDATYGGSNKFKLKGQFLCAKELSFNHPTTNMPMTFSINLPQDFEEVLTKLRLLSQIDSDNSTNCSDNTTK